MFQIPVVLLQWKVNIAELVFGNVWKCYLLPSKASLDKCMLARQWGWLLLFFHVQDLLLEAALVSYIQSCYHSAKVASSNCAVTTLANFGIKQITPAPRQLKQSHCTFWCCRTPDIAAQLLK